MICLILFLLSFSSETEWDQVELIADISKVDDIPYTNLLESR